MLKTWVARRKIDQIIRAPASSNAWIDLVIDSTIGRQWMLEDMAYLEEAGN